MHAEWGCGIEELVTAPRRRIARWRAMFRQGELAQAVYFLEEGRVKLVRQEAPGGREAILDFGVAQAWLGLSAALLEGRHETSAVALAPCQVAVVPAATFCAWARREPGLAWGLCQQLSREVARLQLAASAMASLPARARLERALETLGLPADGLGRQRGATTPPPLRQWELAQLVGVTPEHLSRLLAELEQEGVMRREHGSTALKDQREHDRPARARVYRR